MATDFIKLLLVQFLFCFEPQDDTSRSGSVTQDNGTNLEAAPPLPLMRDRLVGDRELGPSLTRVHRQPIPVGEPPIHGTATVVAAAA